MNSELCHLLEKYVEDTITEAQAQRCAQLLQKDKALFAWFLEEVEFSNLLTQIHDGFEDSDGFVRAFWERIHAEETTVQFTSEFEITRSKTDQANHHKKVIKEFAEKALIRYKAEEHRLEQERAYKEYQTRQRQLFVGISSLAALLAIALFAYFAPKPNSTVEPKPIAQLPAEQSESTALPIMGTVTNSCNAQWDRLDNVTIGSELVPGSMWLSKGVIEITLKSQARIIIEAPSDVNLINDRLVHLNSGILTAYVPQPAQGFEIKTPSVLVTDLGTKFGVLVNNNGVTDVHVLKGFVETSFDGHGTTPRQLHKDSAMRFDATAGSTNPIMFDKYRFPKSWNDILYRPKLKGSLTFNWSTPPSLTIQQFHSNNRIHVFLENTNIPLMSGLHVDINQPGSYQDYTGLTATIPPGSRVDSYLVHWSTNNSQITSMSGNITFRRPILGVIVNKERFLESDTIAGMPNVGYPRNRHLESGEVKNSDSIHLSEDRHSLQMTLRTLPSGADQIRILVQSASIESQ
jgi:ferric-dicitrate binding protein FerR (iron transport regulator)